MTIRCIHATDPYKDVNKMADVTNEKKAKTAKKPQKKSGFSGFVDKAARFITGIPRGIAKLFKDTWSELKKVTWPTWKELVNYTMIVVFFMVMMSVIIGLLDMGTFRLIGILANI